jgi:hypothetical protein
MESNIKTRLEIKALRNDLKELLISKQQLTREQQIKLLKLALNDYTDNLLSNDESVFDLSLTQYLHKTFGARIEAWTLFNEYIPCNSLKIKAYNLDYSQREYNKEYIELILKYYSNDGVLRTYSDWVASGIDLLEFLGETAEVDEKIYLDQLGVVPPIHTEWRDDEYIFQVGEAACLKLNVEYKDELLYATFKQSNNKFYFIGLHPEGYITNIK